MPAIKPTQTTELLAERHQIQSFCALMNRAALKVLFQDVDGCLNPADGEHFNAHLNWEPSLNQIRMLHSINQVIEDAPIEHFVINTGRFWSILEPIARFLPTEKLRYFICEHACVIYDRKHGVNLNLKVLAKQYGLNDLASRYENLGAMHALLDWYDRLGSTLMEEEYRTPLPRLDKTANLSFPLPKNTDGDEVLAFIEKLVRANFPEEISYHFDFCRSDQFIDILPGIHKMDGIELMLALLKHTPEESIAMGDYLNDLAIFESFKQLLCPSNSHPRIKELTAQQSTFGHVSEFAYGTALLDFFQKSN